MNIEEMMHLKTGDRVRVIKSGIVYELVGLHAVATTAGRVGNFRKVNLAMMGVLTGPSFVKLTPKNVELVK